MNRDSAAGKRNDSRYIKQVLAGDEFGDAVDMSADQMPAQFVPKP